MLRLAGKDAKAIEGRLLTYSYSEKCLLTKAGKEYELMVVPGAGHGACETPWANRRRLEFFVKHLRP